MIPGNCTREQYEALIQEIDSHTELPEKYRDLAKRRLMRLYADVVLKQSIELKFTDSSESKKRKILLN